MNNKSKPTDKICMNCEYLLWAIGAGQGLRCKHPDKREEGKSPYINSRFGTCDLFEFKVKNVED